MNSIACFTALLSTISKENRRLFVSRRCWLNVSPLVVNSRQGVSTSTSEEEPGILENEDENQDNNEAVQRIRDISRLNPHHRNIVNGVNPTDEKTMPWHFSTRYNKRLFGRYGYSSGVNPALCWPTKEELEDKMELEKVSYPYSILEVAEREAAKREQAEKDRWERDAKIAANVKSMVKQKEEFLRRMESKKAEAEAAQGFKKRLIEEVRLHFNYSVNERDERFQLEVKERAKLLKEKEKLEKRVSKKERLAAEKALKFEAQKKRLLAEEARQAAAKKKLEEENEGS